MSSSWAIAVAFVAVFTCVVIACLCLRAKDYGHAAAFFLGALLWAYSLTQIPAPVATQQEAEPTPVATEGSGWQDFYDALQVTDAQLDFRLSAVETYIWSAPTATSYPTVIPTATPTATPSAPDLCSTCVKGDKSLGGMTCQNCYAPAGYRWVRSASPNSDCRTCVSEQNVGISAVVPTFCTSCSGPDSPCAPGQSCEDCCYGMSWTCVESLADCNLCRQARMGAAALPEPPLWAGVATWYGMEYAGKPMANQEPYNPFAFSAALDIALCYEYMGRTLFVCARDECIEVEVTDCGYLADSPTALGSSIVDLSMAAFGRLANRDVGVIPVGVWLR